METEVPKGFFVTRRFDLNSIMYTLHKTIPRGLQKVFLAKKFMFKVLGAS